MDATIRPVVAVLPERHGVASSETLFDLIAIAQRGHPFIRTQYARTDLQRNKLAEHLLQTDFTHVLMLDADHRYPPDIVERLTRWVRPKLTTDDRRPTTAANDGAERLVVAGLAFRRCEPYDPNVYLVDRERHELLQPAEWGKGLMPVDIAGTAAMLISRTVFERLPKPWFAMDYSGAADGKWPGEDIWFCERCREAGIRIWVDTTTICPHLREGWVDQRTYESYAAMAVSGAPIRPMVLTENDLTG